MILKDVQAKMRAVEDMLQGRTKLALEFSTRALAVTVISPSNPPGEVDAAQRVAEEIGVDWTSIAINELDNTEFQKNPPNRCYFCKMELMTGLKVFAHREGLELLIDGTNADDLKGHRPGYLALQELNVQSSLAQAGMTKQDIRQVARDYGLSVHDKPAMACLASRIPYGDVITERKLLVVGQAEALVKEAAKIKVIRVRHHGKVARIEVAPDDLVKVIAVADQVVQGLKELGFVYITLDLQGYRSGSMNEGCHPSYAPFYPTIL